MNIANNTTATGKIALALTLFLLFSNKAFSQFYTGPDLDFMALQHSTYMSNVNLINANSQYFAEERRRDEHSRGTKSSSSRATPATFRFVTDRKASAKLKQSIIDNNLKKFPNSKLGEALNDKNNPYPNYVKLLKSLGLDVERDYADAFTAYMLGMWRIANKMSANPSKEQIQNVRNQVLGIIDVSDWNNAQKQEGAEYLVYRLIFANEPFEGSRLDNNRKQMQADSDAVQNRFLKEHNMNLRNMRITATGLTSK